MDEANPKRPAESEDSAADTLRQAVFKGLDSQTVKLRTDTLSRLKAGGLDQLPSDAALSSDSWSEGIPGTSPEQAEGQAAATEPNLDRYGEALLPGGTMLGSNYRVLKRLAEGGQSVVYWVERVSDGKQFAAKVLRKSASNTREYVGRLEREAIATGSIDHPNIANIEELSVMDDEHVFLVQELLIGANLSVLIRSGRRSVESICSVAVQIASALHAAHEQGVIHRDVKPENIFLAQEDGRSVVKVVDFGISKMDLGDDQDRLTRTGHVVGTPTYMSPEHAVGDSCLDSRADLYSLGAVLYQLFFGRSVFEADSAFDMMVKHLYTPATRPPAGTAGVPEGIVDVVMRSLEKEPDDRYPSMEAFSHSLQAAAEQAGIRIVPLPALEDWLISDGLEEAPGPTPIEPSTAELRSLQGTRSWAMPVAGALVVAGLLACLFFFA